MKKVMLDIGHGGKDSGGTGNGLVEKDLNLKVGLMVRDYLKDFEVEINLTREKDVDLTPDNRVSMVNHYNPDLCVSIHHNAADSASARGAEVIHAHYDEFDDKLALSILNKLAVIGMPSRRAFTRLNDRGSDWYYMIRRIWDADTTAIITEGGFVTNSFDAELLKSEDFLRAEALAICEAIAEFLELVPKNIPHWGDKEIEALKAKGLILEKHNSEDMVTWAEFATVLNRVMNKLKE